MGIETILGAGGPIGNELAKILAAGSRPFRLVSRNPTPVAGGELFPADLADREQTIRAVAGSSVVYLRVLNMTLEFGRNSGRGSWQIPSRPANGLRQS